MLPKVSQILIYNCVPEDTHCNFFKQIYYFALNLTLCSLRILPFKIHIFYYLQCVTIFAWQYASV